MFKYKLLAAAFAAAIPMSAHAGDFDYNHIELGLYRGDYGQGDLLQQGHNLQGSFEVTESFYLSGNYRKSNLHVENTFFGLEFRGETDFDYWNLNFGYHKSVNANNDFIAEIGYETNSFESRFFVNDVLNSQYEFGSGSFMGAVGVRSSINVRWETVVKLGIRESISYIDVRPSAEFGVIYKINPTWALDFNAKLDSYGITHYNFGTRAYFGAKNAETSSHQASPQAKFSYSFVQAGLSGFETIYDGRWIGGYDLRGSYGIGENFYIRARYAQYNTGQYDLHDEQQYELGLGYHAALTPSNDFMLDVSRGTVDSGCSIFECTKENGYNVSVGIRTAITDRLQAKAMLGYNDGGDRQMYDGKATANIDISYSLNDKFDILFDTKLLNLHESFYTFGVRAKF